MKKKNAEEILPRWIIHFGIDRKKLLEEVQILLQRYKTGNNPSRFICISCQYLLLDTLSSVVEYSLPRVGESLEVNMGLTTSEHPAKRRISWLEELEFKLLNP